MQSDLADCSNGWSINTDWEFAPLEYNSFLCWTKAYQKNTHIIK